MKKLFIFAATIFCVFSLVYIASASEVTLGWDAPGNAEWGTRLYIGTSPGQYNFSSDAGSGTVQFTISNLVPGETYYFAAKHYFNGMESGFSNEVEYLVPSEITELPPLPGINDEVRRYELIIRKLQ
jgi:hypothetical protein